MQLAELERIAEDIRHEIVEVLTDIGHQHRGHPGASLSITDILTALYFEIMRIDPAYPDRPERDRFILSKGHACPALYVVLARRGFFDAHHLRTFRSVNSLLQGHPDMRKTPGIDMTSGSLGHGLSAGVGMALDAKARRSPAHVYVVLGDGELQEGIVWEAAMTAAKYRLNNLIAFVDCNGLQSGGRVATIMPIEPLADKWKAFGWHVLSIDGHDMAEILAATRAAHRSHKPTVILAQTIKGKGFAYMENDNRWHQACPPRADAAVARTEYAGRPKASSRASFGATVLALAQEGRDVMVVTSDTCSSMGLDEFARQFPDRHIEVGIAEQNLMTVAAGLAACGRKVFVATYATFASMRALEQVRTFLAYPRLHVVIVAGLGGLSGGIEGVAHLAIEDIGILRCIPGMVILNPADAVATGKMVRAAADHPGPVYIRLGRDETPVLFDHTYTFLIGRGNVLAEDGREVALMTTGLITDEVLAASDKLRQGGIGCTVVEFPTLKPLDRELVLWAQARAPVLVTIEEHSVIGGLGSAVMEVLGETTPTLVHRIGIEDCFLESGSPPELREKFGLTADALASRIRSICVNARLAQHGERR